MGSQQVSLFLNSHALQFGMEFGNESNAYMVLATFQYLKLTFCVYR